MGISDSKSLSERTADIIYDLIVNQKKYLPGERIPGENILSVELGVSRTTLREAERALVAQGILEIRRGTGTFVSRNAEQAQDISFKSLEKLRIQAKDLYELRLVFEPAAAKYACIRATEEERQLIIKHGQHVVDLIKNGSPWQDADLNFHQAIVRASHNNFMAQLLPFINRAFTNGIQVTNNSTLLPKIPLQDNPDICRAFEMHDADLARVSMSLHIMHVIQVLPVDPYL